MAKLVFAEFDCSKDGDRVNLCFELAFSGLIIVGFFFIVISFAN